MANYKGEFIEGQIFINDIIHKLRRPIENTMLVHNNLVITGTNIRNCMIAVGVKVLPDGGSDAAANFCNSTTPPTLYFSTAFPGTSTTPLGNPTTGSLPAIPKVDGTDGLIALVKTWMQIYTRVRKVRIIAGLEVFREKNAVLRFTSDHPYLSSINTQIDNAAATSGMAKGTPMTASQLNAFIDSCLGIWRYYCLDMSMHAYNISYCHSNHCNHSNHGSRGRR